MEYQSASCGVTWPESPILKRLSKGDCQDSKLNLSCSVRPCHPKLRERDRDRDRNKEGNFGMVWWYMLASPIHQRQNWEESLHVQGQSGCTMISSRSIKE